MSYSARHGASGTGHRPPKRFKEIEKVDYFLILRDIYPSMSLRPWWARLAHKRGWMLSEDYYDIEETEKNTTGRFSRFLYDDTSFFKLLPKDETFV